MVRLFVVSPFLFYLCHKMLLSMWTIILMCFLWPLSLMAKGTGSGMKEPVDEDLPIVEVKADRTMIYPQRMKLTGEESLLDILLMCPDLMAAGYEDLISGYNLRLDNCAMNGDTRLILSQMKAKDILKIQVCDNTGVAKGTVGMGRVIDINMRKYEGVDAFVEGQAEIPIHNTEGGKQMSGIGTANMLWGNKATEVYVNVSYRYKEANMEYLTLHMTNRLSERDRILTYFTQQYVEKDFSSRGSQKYMGRARYFHTFNDMGTELLLLGGYQYASDEMTRTNLPLWLAELNTPFIKKNLSMMLGVEGDYASTNVKRTGKDYWATNHDLYLQYTYTLEKWRFTAGERIVFYNYGLRMDGEGKRTHDRTSNNMNACVIFVPKQQHQWQVGFYKKYINPAYGALFEKKTTLSDEEWAITRGELKEININQYKLAYAYSRKKLTVQTEASYTDLKDGEDFANMNVSAYLRTDIAGVDAMLTGGVNFYAAESGGYASVRIAPKVYLPEEWQVGMQLVAFTKKNPRREATGVPAYGCLTVSKQWGKHWDMGLDWHDMFDLLNCRTSEVNRNAVVGRVQYRF